jgi:hypothetical protein
MAHVDTYLFHLRFFHFGVSFSEISMFRSWKKWMLVLLQPELRQQLPELLQPLQKRLGKQQKWQQKPCKRRHHSHRK